MISAFAPLLTLLPVLWIVFGPKRRALQIVRIDGRHLRGLNGTIDG